MENRLSEKWRNILSYASTMFCMGALAFNLMTNPNPPAPPMPDFMMSESAFKAECNDLKSQAGARKAHCVIIETETPDGYVQFALGIE